MTFQRGLLCLASYPYASRWYGVRAELWPDEFWAWVEWVRPNVWLDHVQNISVDDWWFLRRMTGLDLSGNKLPPQAIETLVRLPQLSGLLDLNLSDNEVNGDVAQALAQSPHLTRLLRVQVSGKVSAEAQDLLERRFGAGVVFVLS